MAEPNRYRTIVADPPWPVSDYGARSPSRAGFWAERHDGLEIPVPYERMSTEEIAALPVAELAEPDAHLYLWAVNQFLPEAYDVARAWGFRPSSLLTWCKAPRGMGMGGAFVNTTEFLLFARRGSLPHTARVETTWFNWKRPYVDGKPAHSAKPPGAQDIIEQVSPGPYVELFARRDRLGWDTWGNESLGTAEMCA
jgi:N6-adenosine-specific RNA methylase IME4